MEIYVGGMDPPPKAHSYAGGDSVEGQRVPAFRVPMLVVIALLVLILLNGVVTSYLLYDIAKEIGASHSAVTAHFVTTEGELRALRDFARVAEAETRRPRQWEYRIESPSDYTFEEAMKEYGRDGWELVAARRASSGGIMSYEMIFKRVKP